MRRRLLLAAALLSANALGATEAPPVVVTPALAPPVVMAVEAASPPGISPARTPARQGSGRARFGNEGASGAVLQMADWVIAAGDNESRSFIIIDKRGAKVFAFDQNGLLLGAAPALLGLARGDTNPSAIGDKPLSAIPPADRITPSGRFTASLGHDLGDQDIIWVDYASALSLHRVIRGKPADRRMQRLASATTLDNRITYGCINVPVDFYERVIRPMFVATTGIVYLLPETQPIEAVFAMVRPK